MRVFYLICAILLIHSGAFAIDNAQVWNEYLSNAEKTIKGNWYKLSGMQRHSRECKTNLYFNIKNTGEISGIKVLASDCDEDVKKLAIRAVETSSPLNSFPSSINSTKEISIDYIFNYELLPENKPIYSDSPLTKNQTSDENIVQYANDLLNSETVEQKSDTVSVESANKASFEPVDKNNKIAVNSYLKYGIAALICLLLVIVFATIIILKNKKRT